MPNVMAALPNTGGEKKEEEEEDRNHRAKI